MTVLQDQAQSPVVPGRRLRAVRLLAVVWVSGLCVPGVAAALRIDAPQTVLDGIPVRQVRIWVDDGSGRPDAAVSSPVSADGLLYRDGDGQSLPLPALERGELVVRSDPAARRRLLVTGDIRVRLPDADGAGEARHAVRVLPGWVSLVPAAVAIGLAVWLKNVLVALFVAIWCGVALVIPGERGWPARIGAGLIRTVDEALVNELADPSHLMIVLFTLLLGCLVGVMSASGGTRALIDRLTPITRSRRGAQVTTWALGLVVFFDDYANALLLGSTMRPVTDRQRISREKLAFLVDSTAAPVAGLAIVSTWVGFEVGLIRDSLATLAAASPEVAIPQDAYSIFLATIPYRFYPALLLVFVLAVAWTGRDFGPMRAAERRALAEPPDADSLAHPPADSAAAAGAGAGEEYHRVRAETTPAGGTMWNALVPLAALFGFLVIGFWWTGWEGYWQERGGVEVAERGAHPGPTLWQLVSAADSNRVLLVSSFLASACAVLMALLTRSLSLHAALEAWLEGARSMLLGVCVLVLAWAIATVCDEAHLNTAGYLVDLTTGQLSAGWMPTLAFVLSAAIAFATGSSWATMGLLIPLVISVTFGLLSGADVPGPVTSHPLMLASIGGVLAGSIFGDHCSPISDTTVLSSVAADCDHLRHVATQLPYAVCVGLISILLGTLPAGLGWSGWWLLPVGMLAVCALVRLLGRPVGSSQIAK